MAVEARLIECGLRWSDIGEDRHTTWREVLAVVETEPPWGPISRVKDSKEWVWYIPGYNELVTLLEQTILAGYQRAGKKANGFKPARRPWDKKRRRIATNVLPIEKMDKFLNSRLNGKPDNETTE